MIRLLTLIFAFTALASINVYAGLPVVETDTTGYQLAGFFDLRDRESFIQITHTSPVPRSVHIQVFNVGNLCNENNFFDNYTPNDTHVYNLRDIVTNDGNPAGFVLPDDAYGIFVATQFSMQTLIGNLRIEDNNGYEYRTNLNDFDSLIIDSRDDIYSFNFNSESGVVLSDVVGIMLSNVDDTKLAEVFAANIVDILVNFDIDIYDTNEVPFSCRNVVFACTDQNNPLLPALFEDLSNCSEYSGRGGCNANVASFEYGINEAIPSSKGAPLLCPGNVITDGIVQLTTLGYKEVESAGTHAFVLFVGLNNGNGRGSIDAMWQDNDPCELGECQD